MQFGSAMTLQDRLKFAEGSKLASSRDTRNTDQLWKKVRNDSRQKYTSVQSIEKLNRVVAGMRRRIVGGFDTSETELMFPFKIYGIENITATSAQKVQFSTLNLDINAFTFQIRSGIVSGRPYINVPGGSNDPQIVLPAVPTSGNFESLLYVTCTDQPPNNGGNVPEDFFYQAFPNTGVSIVLDNKNPTLLYGIPKGSAAGTPVQNCNQIILNQTTESDQFDNFWGAAFWLELVDDPLNGFYVNLMGCMFSQSPPSPIGRTGNPFPNGINIIPLGFVIVQQTVNLIGLLTTQVTNFVTGNLLNRFSATTSRGRWNELYAALPAGKTQLTWYPGDIVVDDVALVTDPTSGFQYYKVFQNTDVQTNRYTVGQNPALPTGTWQVVGISE